MSENSESAARTAALQQAGFDPKHVSPAAHHSLLLLSLPGVGVASYWALLEHYGSIDAIRAAPAADLPLPAEAKSRWRGWCDRGVASDLHTQLCDQLAPLQGTACTVLHHSDQDYPQLLRHIDKPPPVLFVCGCVELLAMPQIALVGGRKASTEGVDNAHRFARQLAQAGFAITSGLALGIDAAAHRGALAAGGVTVAVMATGIDVIYPALHRPLARDIVARGGALVTEFLPRTPPRANHFPQRNRLISGLSIGVVVVEAAKKSGSLITARCALEQGREVFALPNSIHRRSAEGSNQLLKEGAYLAQGVEDIVSGLDSGLQLKRLELCCEPVDLADTAASTSSASERPTTEPPDTGCCSPTERALLQLLLEHQPMQLDQLLDRSGETLAEISRILLELELKQMVQQTPLGYQVTTQAALA